MKAYIIKDLNSGLYYDSKTKFVEPMSINTKLFKSKNEAVLFACLQILDEDLAWRLLEKVYEKERWEIDCSKDEFRDAINAFKLTVVPVEVIEVRPERAKAEG